MSFSRNGSFRQTNIFKTLLYYCYIAFQTLKNKIIEFMDSMVQFSDTIKQSEIIYFDFETTGLNPYHCNIIDYAFLLEEPDSKETYIESLINPEEKFDKKITDITGIHPDDLIEKPVIQDKVDEIYNFINSRHKQVFHKHIPEVYLVAHNCDGFDKIFLMRLFENRERYPLAANWKFIDTLPLAKKLLPRLQSHSLKNISQNFNIKSGTHRALSDTVCLKEVFEVLLKTLCASEGRMMTHFKENPQRIIDYYSFN